MTKETTKKIKKQAAYEYIKTRILNGAYGPGYRIVIDRVAKELKLSTIPVREAIQQLEADGLIQIIPYSGAIVQQLNETDYQDAVYVMLVLEGAATALASKKLNERDIAKLEIINKDMKDALEQLDYERVGELNVRFHASIHEKCGNSYLVERIKQVWQRISQIRHASIAFAPIRAREAVDEHEKLIQLLKEKTPESVIEDYVRQHKLNTLHAVQSFKKNNNNYLIHSM